MRKSIKYLRVCPLIVIVFFLLLFLPDTDQLTRLPSNERDNYLRKARVWHKTDIANADIMAGPRSSVAVPPEAEVRCRYTDETLDIGHTPKFKCRLFDTGEVVRVKYSRRETFAEIAGTRLLWALGFFTDETYPVKLRCYDCPALDPSNPEDKQERMERLIPDAIIERDFPGAEIAQFPDQGWSWAELELVAHESGGSKQAELDALKLLAVFIQHGDSKPPQQRLACYPQNLRWRAGKLVCSSPVLMVQDLGATFGTGYRTVGAFSAMYYRGWERVDIWNAEKENRFAQENGRKACFGQLTSAFDNGLVDPQISEEGRRFLAGLLNQLTDDQIRDLFRVARADLTKETFFQEGREIRVTVEHWLDAFKKKREQINTRDCS